MKVAFVSQPFEDVSPFHEGSSSSSLAVWTNEVARRLVSTSNVTIYARKGNSNRRVEHDAGIQYRRVSTALEDRFTRVLRLLERLARFPRRRRPVFASRLYYLTYIIQIAKDIRAQACDIVHIFNFSQFVPVIRAFNPSIRIVLHMHCEWLTQLDRDMVEKRLKKADLIVGCSDYITNNIRSSFPRYASRCQTVLNGVDIFRFSTKRKPEIDDSNRPRRLLYVGRVSPEKGLHVLLEAFSKVVEQYPRVQLEIVGAASEAPFDFTLLLSDDQEMSALAGFYTGAAKKKGLYVPRLREQLSAENLADKVMFRGNVPHAALGPHYHNADIFVFPSVWQEPFGIPLVEAMASQVPVVASRSGGIPEIVGDRKTGFLVDRGDAPTLADAVLTLLRNHELRRTMGAAGRERVTNLFCYEHIADTLLEQYKALVRRAG